jgi:hypothetical protein
MTEPDERTSYVEEFLRLARASIRDGLGAWGGELERLHVDSTGLGGSRITHVTAFVRFRGRRFAFRRRVWPPNHPVKLTVTLYATSLEERLLTGRYRAGSGDPVPL